MGRGKKSADEKVGGEHDQDTDLAEGDPSGVTEPPRADGAVDTTPDECGMCEGRIVQRGDDQVCENCGHNYGDESVKADVATPEGCNVCKSPMVPGTGRLSMETVCSACGHINDPVNMEAPPPESIAALHAIEFSRETGETPNVAEGDIKITVGDDHVFFPQGIWCSTVAQVSAGGEVDNRFYQAEAFHNGGSHLDGHPILGSGGVLALFKQHMLDEGTVVLHRSDEDTMLEDTLLESTVDEILASFAKKYDYVSTTDAPPLEALAVNPDEYDRNCPCLKCRTYYEGVDDDCACKRCAVGREG